MLKAILINYLHSLVLKTFLVNWENHILKPQGVSPKACCHATWFIFCFCWSLSENVQWQFCDCFWVLSLKSSTKELGNKCLLIPDYFSFWKYIFFHYLKNIYNVFWVAAYLLSLAYILREFPFWLTMQNIYI